MHNATGESPSSLNLQASLYRLVQQWKPHYTTLHLTEKDIWKP